MEIKLNSDLLRAMLREAYEAGWYGVRELSDEQVDAIIRRNESKFEQVKVPLNFSHGHPPYGTGNYPSYNSQLPLNISDHPVLGGQYNISPINNPLQWDFGDFQSNESRSIELNSQQNTIQLTNTHANVEFVVQPGVGPVHIAPQEGQSGWDGLGGNPF